MNDAHVWISTDRVLAALRPQNGALHNASYLDVDGVQCVPVSLDTAALVAVFEAVQNLSGLRPLLHTAEARPVSVPVTPPRNPPLYGMRPGRGS